MVEWTDILRREGAILSKAKDSGRSGLPEHKLIQDSIVNDIIRGVYEKGAMIPKQEFFSQKFGVSRSTVRHRRIDSKRDFNFRQRKGHLRLRLR